MTLLSTIEAAKRLGVSTATIRNWSRAGYLQAAAGRPLSFQADDITDLKERIRTNRFNRLRKRANKTALQEQTAMPDSEASLAGLGPICEYVGKHRRNPATALFAAAMSLLALEDEARLPASGTINANTVTWRRSPVSMVMREWQKRLAQETPRLPEDVIRPYLYTMKGRDSLGLLYQGLSSVGAQSLRGAYFTPETVIEDSLSALGKNPTSFLDPCCGTGRYLIRAAGKWAIDPEQLYGFDSDPVSVDIARLNLLLMYRDLDFMPRVECLDSLQELATGDPGCATNHLLGAIDAIATNPPWGGCKNTARHKTLISLIKSGESFSLFLEKSLQLTRPGGLLSFLLPESILKIKTHADVRRLLLQNTCIRKIAVLGRVFPGVFTPIVRLDLIKREPPATWSVKVDLNPSSHQIKQTRFTSNTNAAFDIFVTPDDTALMDKIFSTPHITLERHAEWAMGIVTGDNQKCILDKAGATTEPILRGRDILKFAAKPPRSHIVFRLERFQQVAPEHRYRAPEKLIYRFISDHLIFAYDNAGLLTLNSANIVIPQLPGISIKTALAFLNSRIFQFVFSKRFRTRKVLRSDLEQLPFPLITKRQGRTIDRMVDLCLGGDYQPARDLDAVIYKVFGFSDRDIVTLEASLAKDAHQVVL